MDQIKAVKSAVVDARKALLDSLSESFPKVDFSGMKTASFELFLENMIHAHLAKVNGKD